MKIRALPRKRPVLPLPIVALVALTLAACASSPGQTTMRSLADLSPDERNSVLLTAADPTDRPECRVSLEPPPPLAELVDSAAVHAAAAEGFAAAGAPAGRAVLTVRADSAGRTEWVRVLESDFPDPLTESIASSFEDRLRPRTVQTDSGPARRGWTHRIAMERDGADPRLRVGPSVMCPPAFRNAQSVSRVIEEEMAARRIGSARLGTGKSTLVWVSVGDDGRAGEVQVRRSSGDPELDFIARKAAATARFRPAMVDGRQVRVWSAFPIRFEPSQPPAPPRAGPGR